jgi:hypothetical protein
VPRRIYKRLLREAIDSPADWCGWPCETAMPGAEVARILSEPRA